MIKSILILGSFAKGALENQYAKRLKENGWVTTCLEIQQEVHCLKNKNIGTKILFNLAPDVYYKNINELVLQTAKREQPIVILVFKGMELWPTTIKKLRNNCKLLCNYNPDHPFNFFSKGAGNSNVLKSIIYFDIFLSYSGSICKQVKNKYQIDSHCIPFGYDETLKPIKTSSQHILNQILFIGAWDKEREIYIKKLADSRLQVFGPGIWEKKLESLSNIDYNVESLYTQDYANACFSAKGILNFLRPQNIKEQSHNMRTFEVPGYNGLLISERTDDQQFFFEENKEAIYFNSIEELKDKLIYLNTHPKEVEKLKINANKRAIRSGYNYTDRTRELLNILHNNV